MLRPSTKRLGEPGHGKGGSSRTVKALRALIGLYWPQLEPPPWTLGLYLRLGAPIFLVAMLVPGCGVCWLRSMRSVVISDLWTDFAAWCWSCHHGPVGWSQGYFWSLLGLILTCELASLLCLSSALMLWACLVTTGLCPVLIYMVTSQLCLSPASLLWTCSVIWVDPGCYHGWPAPLPCLGAMISGGASTLLAVLLSPCPSGSSQPLVIPDKDQVLVVMWSLAPISLKRSQDYSEVAVTTKIFLQELLPREAVLLLLQLQMRVHTLLPCATTRVCAARWWTRAIVSALEDNKARLYSGQKSGSCNFTLKCFWKSGWKITEVKDQEFYCVHTRSVWNPGDLWFARAENNNSVSSVLVLSKLSLGHEGPTTGTSCNWQCSCLGLSYVSEQSSKHIHLGPMVLGIQSRLSIHFEWERSQNPSVLCLHLPTELCGGETI